MSENVLILGATSGIARALAHVMAARGCSLLLAGRDLDSLQKQAADLRIRYSVQIEVEQFQASDSGSAPQFIARCASKFADGLTGLVLCYGSMGTTTDADESQRLREIIDTNFTSAAIVLEAAADYMVGRKGGYIAAISSVAGDRGRMSNYAYGAAKAGLSAYLSGLRNRLFHEQVHVLTILPGFVNTPMTEGLLNPKSPLVASPERVARDIDRAIRRRRNVLYTPWFWRWIMLIIRMIPEPIFKRLKL